MGADGSTPIVYLHEHSDISGGETSLLLLWEHLDRERFPAVLLAPEGPLLARARELGVTCCAMDFPRFRAMLSGRGARCLAAVRRHVRRHGPVVLHGNTPHTNLVASCAAFGAGPRVIWHERTLPAAGERDIDRWLRWLPDRIICNSRAVARRFGGPSRRVRVVYNGVDLDRFRPDCGGAAVRTEWDVGPEEVAIGIVGNFSVEKRHELLLRAIASLPTDSAQWRLFVIGGEVFPDNRGREASLRSEVERLGLKDVVVLAGYRADIPAVMDALDILVSPSEVEACSRAILEAMASGVPVVAADAGGNPELVEAGRTGLLFPAEDADGLAAALHRVLLDRVLRASMGRAARAVAAERFGIERQVRETEAVYEELVRPDGRGADNGARPDPRGV